MNALRECSDQNPNNLNDKPDVSVTAGSVPVSLYGFRVKTDDHIEFLGYPTEYPSGYPQHVSHLYTFTRTYLILPLWQGLLLVATVEWNSYVEIWDRKFSWSPNTSLSRTTGSKNVSKWAGELLLAKKVAKQSKLLKVTRLDTWEGMTSAFDPAIFIPAYKHAL